jgi:aminodeoxyfutalosine synthase
LNIPFKILRDPALVDVAKAVIAGRRVSEDAALAMLQTTDVNGLGVIAGAVRKKRHGLRTYYGSSLNLNYTNVCALRCPLCAFSCDKEDTQAYVLELDDVRSRVLRALAEGVDEIHIVGALNPDIPFDYYQGLVKTIRDVDAHVHIVGFTATEYDYMSQLSGKPVGELLRSFRDCGVDALPGGGAEIFAENVRQQIAPKKISGKRWLGIMREAHQAGLRSNATVLYNHVETNADLVDHLRQLRELQDETGGFKALVPLPYHGTNSEVPARQVRASGVDSLRLFATARIYLDNFDHIKALWMYLGEKLVQVLQQAGADDAGATYLQEQIVHAAGAATPQSGTESGLRKMIEQAGCIPVRTNASYR